MIKTIFNWLKKPTTKISFQQAFDLTNLPVVTFKQGNDKYNFLLDTGSSDNIINSACLKNLKHEMYEGTSDLTGMDGIKHTVCACDLTFSYKDVEYTYLYLIKDMKDAFGYIKQETGVTLHGIIGTKFFAQYKYILDFENLVAYSKA